MCTSVWVCVCLRYLRQTRRTHFKALPHPPPAQSVHIAGDPLDSRVYRSVVFICPKRFVDLNRLRHRRHDIIQYDTFAKIVLLLPFHLAS